MGKVKHPKRSFNLGTVELDAGAVFERRAILYTQGNEDPDGTLTKALEYGPSAE